MKYSRKNPSEKYLQLITFYNEMQKNGYLQTNGKIGNFDGTTVPFFAKIIKKIIMQYRCKSLLDYGCGKAKYYFNDFIVKNEKFPNLKDYWKVKIKLYDPAVKQFNKFTSKKYDISTKDRYYFTGRFCRFLGSKDKDYGYKIFIDDNIVLYTSSLRSLVINNF